jgi:hypothetical protein
LTIVRTAINPTHNTNDDDDGVSDGKELWERVVGKSCRKELWERVVGKSCGKELWERVVGKSCDKWEIWKEGGGGRDFQTHQRYYG